MKAMTKKNGKKSGSLSQDTVSIHNICGHFSEEDIIWNVLRLKPGHSIIIEAIDNSEYTLTEDKTEAYADVIRSNTYFWRPLSNYDGLNPSIPNRTKSKVNVSKKIVK